MEFGCVSVRGIGTWTLSIQSGQFALDKQTLSPPRTHAAFTVEENSEFEFTDLMTESGCPAQMSRSLESWMTHDKLESDKNNISFILPGMGQISDNIFIPDDAMIFDKFAGWLPVASPFFPRHKDNISHLDDYVFRLNNPYQAQKKEDTWFSHYWGPLLLAVFLLLAILLWFWAPSPDTAIKTPATPEIITENLAGEDHLSGIRQDSLKTVSEVSTDISDTVEEPLKEENTEAIQTATGEECVLIVGSFRRQNNSERMVENLRKEGYETYTETHNGFKRVGFIYNCGAQNPDSFKDNMRQNTFPGAWNLHDTL